MTDAEKEARRLVSALDFARVISKWAWGWESLDAWQAQVMDANERFLLLNCSRQSGKSSILMVKAFHRAISVAGALILIIAEQRQSNEDLRKVRELHAAYQQELQKRYGGQVTLSLITDNVTSLEFANHSRIVALPANEKVRGFSAPNMVIIDEAAYLDDEVFVAIDPMMEVSKGQMILASTPNGTTGFYYKEWQSPRYRKFRVPWRECPRISEDSIREKRMLLGEAYVKQEYETEFLDELASLFSERALHQSIVDEEDVLADEMKKINSTIRGDVELI